MKKAKILIYDIETFANLSYVWGMWEQNVIDVEKDWYMLCFAYKWLGESKTHVISQRQFKGYKPQSDDDSNVVKKLWELFDDADITIAHNGNSFDTKKANARFILNGLNPPSYYQQIDTKLVARKHFKFDSNKLDHLGDYFNIGRKINTGGFELWKGCMKGEKKSWDKMERYNIQDVKLLEKVYLKMRPWMDVHPNQGLIIGKDMICPICASKSLQKRGYRLTRVSKFQRWQCNSCGGWSSSRLSDNTFKPSVK